MIDTGANLTHESFSADLDQVLERARASGVTRIVVTGASRQGSIDALELARRYPDYLVATAGNHPHHASDYDADMDALLRDLAGQPEVRACGEAGLDYFRDFSPRPDQQRCFEAQLDIAVEAGKPIFLHQRDAHDDFIAMVRPFRDRLDRMVVHCFTDTRRALFDYLDLDLHVGITGWICDERRGHHLRELVANIPAGRLMIETDSPYLLPRDLKPKPKSRRNEPFHLPHIARVIAECRDETLEQTAAHTTATAEAFFNLS
ncbi:MAG: TatD family hydrolase [Xanthomonadales bacterium]|nr:TatD family hydrolase [Xanthomonadales bacterium]